MSTSVRGSGVALHQHSRIEGRHVLVEQQLITHGDGPYFGLPKLEVHLEARLWNNVFNLVQNTARISHPRNPSYRQDFGGLRWMD